MATKTRRYICSVTRWRSLRRAASSVSLSTKVPRWRTSSPPPPAQRMFEPLSPRELEVLHLMAAGLSNQEMCERLFLALSTVKGHNRTIFGKLGVQRRTEAVARARELGLV